MCARNLLGALACLLAAASCCRATQVIANWDLVPCQRIDAAFKIGVVAFHETGVEVVFRVDGVHAATATEPTWNDRTEVYEYWFELDPADYPDGPITLSATAFPNDPLHQSRTLSDVTLYANSGGTLDSTAVIWAATDGNDTTGTGTEANPYRTIKKAIESAGDGGTVYLKAGTYKLAPMPTSGLQYWTTVQAAPGLTADDVRIACMLEDGSSTNDYLRTLVRWHKLTLFNDYINAFQTIMYGRAPMLAWYDGVVMYDARGSGNGTQPYFGTATVYVTNSVLRDMWNADGQFHRNVYIENICSDIYRARTDQTSINVTIRRMDAGETTAHSDFFQWYNPGTSVENIIVYNCRVYDAVTQGILCGFETEDVAFVNLMFEFESQGMALSTQMRNCDMDHVLLWHVTYIGQRFLFLDDYVVSNWNVRNNNIHVFSAGPATALPASCDVDYNHVAQLHWDQSAPLGNHATLGDPQFRDSGCDDYRVMPTSPCYHRGVPLECVPADIDGVPYDPVAPTLGCFSSAGLGPVQYMRQSTLTGETTGWDDPASLAEVLLPGRAVRLTGDAWKYVPLYHTTQTATMLEVTVAASDSGELLAIVLDDDIDGTNTRRAFRLGGSDADDGELDTFSWRVQPTDMAADGTATYRIPVGRYFTGEVNYLGFVAVDDTDASADVVFSDIRLTTGNPVVPGDADGDGDVDLDDFVILKNQFGTTSGATYAQGDFDGDGDVDLDDFVVLKQNFGL